MIKPAQLVFTCSYVWRPHLLVNHEWRLGVLKSYEWLNQCPMWGSLFLELEGEERSQLKERAVTVSVTVEHTWIGTLDEAGFAGEKTLPGDESTVPQWTYCTEAGDDHTTRSHSRHGNGLAVYWLGALGPNFIRLNWGELVVVGGRVQRGADC